MVTRTKSPTTLIDAALPKLVQLHEQIEQYKQAINKYDYVDMIDKYIQVGDAKLDYLFIDEGQDFTLL